MPWNWFRRGKTVATPTAEADAPVVIIEGRRMAVNSPYLLPKDLEESSRLDLQHYMLRYVLRGNLTAPIGPAPRDILDVGCGTGRWGGEVARQFPGANVIGVDLVAPQSNSVAVTQGHDTPPDNYVFIEGDVTKGLNFPDASFDYVHMRLVVLALPFAQWGQVARELARVTKPGGWVELVETAVEARTPAGQIWVNWAQTLAAYRGINLAAGNQIGRFLSEAGMRQVRQTTVEIPLGSWGGRVGRLMGVDAVAGAKAMKTAAVHQAKLVGEDEFDRTITAMAHEFETIEATQPFYVAVGQK